MKVHSTLLAVALPVALACAARSEAGPINACGNAGTPPQLFGAVLDNPGTLDGNDDPPVGWNPGSARLTRGGIHYVSGNYVHLRLLTDQCTFIMSVRFGTRILTTTGEGGYGYYVDPAPVQPKDPTQHAHGLRVQFANIGDGSTDEVTVWVGRTLGGGSSVQYRFTVVRVQAVEGRFIPAPIGVSRAEIFNMFGRALYAMFNGPANSTIITGADGSQRHIYGYDPSSLGVSVSPAGIGFQFKFKVDDICDPTIRAYGTFTLTPSFSIDWVHGPDASPSGCEVLQLIPLVGLVVNYLIEDGAADAATDIRSAIEAAVLGQLPNTAAIIAADVTTENEQLLVHALGTEPSIRIRVPYDAFDLVRSPTAFPPGQAITLVASGAGMYDAAAGTVPPAPVWSGPNGVPLAGTTSWPNPRTLARSGLLPWPGGPVARLLARTVPTYSPNPEPTVTYAYRPGCSIPASMQGVGRLRFGVNDTAADAQRLRGYVGSAPGYGLRVYFGGTSTTCASYDEPSPPPPAEFD